MSQASAADWWQVGTSAVSALATFAAVAAAFIVQRRQATSDQALATLTTSRHRQGACSAVKSAKQTFDIISEDLVRDREGSKAAAIWASRESLKTELDTLSYFISMPIDEFKVAQAVVQMSSMMRHTIEDLDLADGDQAKDPNVWSIDEVVSAMKIRSRIVDRIVHGLD